MLGLIGLGFSDLSKYSTATERMFPVVELDTNLNFRGFAWGPPWHKVPMDWPPPSNSTYAEAEAEAYDPVQQPCRGAAGWDMQDCEKQGIFLYFSTPAQLSQQVDKTMWHLLPGERQLRWILTDNS